MTEKENFDWIDNYGFILVAFAHMTNWRLSDAEIQTISSKLQLMLSQSNQDYNEEQVAQKLVKILNFAFEKEREHHIKQGSYSPGYKHNINTNT